ncbi:(2Fe-2S)-binding protein (plasmid) [Paraburkholderia sp. PREW-6R]|uniref:(2Fe-2S)-binding protein n=1 Tax=Paraburkholderia sp. PREW-6R TaxID=3141544 RepID=UPI0031F4AD65
MFRPLTTDVTRRMVAISIEGRLVHTREGGTVALALLEAGVNHTRTTPVSGAPRAPYCLMGACFECLVEVDGQPNVQACMVEVRDGMRVSIQRGAREPGGKV